MADVAGSTGPLIGAADERSRGLDRDRRAGLTRADELAIIAALVDG